MALGLAIAAAAVTTHDLAAARRAIVDVLAGNVVEKDGRAGIPNYLDALVKSTSPEGHNMVFGFTGKNLEAARFLLREAELDASPRGLRLRRLGETIIASFLQLKVAPPEGEGFQLESGHPICALGRPEVYLRSFGDDLKALCRPISARSGSAANMPSGSHGVARSAIGCSRNSNRLAVFRARGNPGRARCSPPRPTRATTPSRCSCC